MPTNAEMIRLLGKIGSDRRTVKTTLLTHLRHQPSGTPARRMPSQMRFSAARKAELSLIGLARKRRRVKWGSRSPMATPYSVVGSKHTIAQAGPRLTVFSRCWAALPMQVKINAYLSQRRRMALRPFSQVTSASVPSRESREVLHYFQTLVP